jgi:histidinol-phosphate/aromatic aminotransferase/cobyric acid decarboxylase-like protein
LGGALSRLMVVAENYPQLKATENFSELQAQLEGTENWIKEERRRFNEAVKGFNSLVVTFPNNLIASFSGFTEKGFFQAEANLKKHRRLISTRRNNAYCGRPTSADFASHPRGRIEDLWGNSVHIEVIVKGILCNVHRCFF